MGSYWSGYRYSNRIKGAKTAIRYYNVLPDTWYLLWNYVGRASWDEHYRFYRIKVVNTAIRYYKALPGYLVLLLMGSCWADVVAVPGRRFARATGVSGLGSKHATMFRAL